MEKPVANSLSIGIIGGGAAGMSCALWLKQLGYTPLIIERGNQLGGQLLDIDRLNRWVLGLPSLSSIELAQVYADHIKQESITIFYQTQLLVIEKLGLGYQLNIKKSDNTCLSLPVIAIVIATGIRPIGAEMFAQLDGFPAVLNKGLISFFPLDHIAWLTTLQNKTVAVVGGGDNAHYTAKDIALANAHTHLLVRSLARAQKLIRKEIEELIAQSKIIEHSHSQINRFKLNHDKIEVTLSHTDATTVQIEVDRIFVRTGFTPNIEFLDNFEVFSGIAKQSVYLQVDAAQRTSIPWVYAIGDVVGHNPRSVVNAIASGAIAAQDISERI
ncbi:MAG: NAD(P)/FAD-dependent oxidoreductase [Methylococcaceae bacterium]|jgi:thioredoxin reductase